MAEEATIYEEQTHVLAIPMKDYAERTTGIKRKVDLAAGDGGQQLVKQQKKLIRLKSPCCAGK